MNQEQKLEYQEIAMKISDYPNDRFESNALHPDEIRLHYLKMEPTLERLERAKEELALLQSGKNVLCYGML